MTKSKTKIGYCDQFSLKLSSMKDGACDRVVYSRSLIQDKKLSKFSLYKNFIFKIKIRRLHIRGLYILISST